jgi:hypothetical protein
MAESNLDPDAMSAPPDRSVGLFQLMAGGLGAGHGVAEASGPCGQYQHHGFGSAKIRSIRFCSVFARCCQRFRPHAHAAPPDPASEIVNRVTIAERLAQTS